MPPPKCLDPKTNKQTNHPKKGMKKTKEDDRGKTKNKDWEHAIMLHITLIYMTTISRLQSFFCCCMQHAVWLRCFGVVISLPAGTIHLQKHWKLFLENCLALESGPSMFITRFLFLLLSLFFFSSFSPCFYAFWMLCTDFKQLCFGILKECIRFQGHQLLNTIKQKQPFQSLVLEIIIITESHVCKYTHL